MKILIFIVLLVQGLTAQTVYTNYVSLHKDKVGKISKDIFQEDKWIFSDDKIVWETSGKTVMYKVTSINKNISSSDIYTCYDKNNGKITFYLRKDYVAIDMQQDNLLLVYKINQEKG